MGPKPVEAPWTAVTISKQPQVVRRTYILWFAGARLRHTQTVVTWTAVHDIHKPESDCIYQKQANSHLTLSGAMYPKPLTLSPKP